MRDFDRRLAKLEIGVDQREEHWFVQHDHDGCEEQEYFGMGKRLDVTSREEAEKLFPGLKISWIIVHHRAWPQTEDN